MSTLLSAASTDIDKARLRAVSVSHSGDWLQAAPIASIGLKLTDEEMRISIAQRLGIRAGTPHPCICGKIVDTLGLHGLSCRKSDPRLHRHAKIK